MISSKSIRAGILVAIATAGSLSCGETEFTQPNPTGGVVAVRTFERFLNSPQQESRELLIDGRVTDIEWNVTGDPSIVLMEGVSGNGGSYYVSVRSLWTVGALGPDGILFLLQWPDLSENRFEEPLFTSADIITEQGDTLQCGTDDTLVREESWTRSDDQEDEVTIEFYSDSLGSYPSDVWRWGASTTDFASPVALTEFQGAGTENDTLGVLLHPLAATMEDFFDTGGGPIRDSFRYPGENAPRVTFIPNHVEGSNVPRRIADKGTRDSRFNRGKPLRFVVWETVSKPLADCDVGTVPPPPGRFPLNPIRNDDAAQRDKTWNPGDYVPSYRLQLAHGSQADVLAKAGWNAGKWALEVRRDLIPRPPDGAESAPPIPNGVPDEQPRPDDLQLEPGRRYVMRITITDGQTNSVSRSGLIPIYLKPTSP
jgi:hypothetical protein